eukprot:scaffold17_cov354-Pavlova_lutheri.AAC.4
MRGEVLRTIHGARREWEAGHVEGGNALQELALATSQLKEQAWERDLNGIGLKGAVKEAWQEKAKQSGLRLLSAVEVMCVATATLNRTQESLLNDAVHDHVRMLAARYAAETRLKMHTAGLAMETLKRVSPTCLPSDEANAVLSRVRKTGLSASNEGYGAADPVASLNHSLSLAQTNDHSSTSGEELAIRSEMTLYQTVWRLYLEMDPSAVEKLLYGLLGPRT